MERGNKKKSNFSIRMANHKVISKEKYTKTFVIEENPQNVIETSVDNDNYRIVFRRNNKNYVFVNGTFSQGATIQLGKIEKTADSVDDLRLKLMAMKQLESYHINTIWNNIKPAKEFDFSLEKKNNPKLTFWF